MLSHQSELVLALGEALAIGLLVGIERYRSRSEGDRQSAGVRTFAIISVLGAVLALLAQPMFTVATFVGLLALLALGYWRESENSVGLTTEIATILTFWLGYLVAEHETLAIGTAIVVTWVLAHKTALHGFVRRGLTALELYDTLKFLLVVFVVYPLLPEGPVAGFELLEPRQFWLLVILVSSISYVGYLLVRVLGGNKGLLLTSLVGGLVSTTAVTVSLAQRAKAAPAQTRLFGVLGVMANAVQGPRLLVLVAVVSEDLAMRLALPLLAMSAVGLGGATLLARLRKVWDDQAPVEVLLVNPYSFKPAFKFALLFAGVLVLSDWAKDALGEQAILPLAAVAGTVDASAISISVAELFGRGDLGIDIAAYSVLVAVGVNAIVKIGLAWSAGGRGFAFWLGGGLLSMVATAGGLLWLMGH